MQFTSLDSKMQFTSLDSPRPDHQEYISFFLEKILHQNFIFYNNKTNNARKLLLRFNSNPNRNGRSLMLLAEDAC